jgi:hypothetical protein
MSTPIAECVLDAVDVPGQFRDQVPRCETGHPLSYAREVADGLCERLESDKQILPRPEDAGLENSPPPPSSLRQTASTAPRCIAFLPPARASADEPPNRVSDGTVNRGEEGDRERSTYATGPSTEGLLVSLPRPIAARRNA